MSNKEAFPEYEGVQNFNPTGSYPSNFAKPVSLDANNPVVGGSAKLGGGYVSLTDTSVAAGAISGPHGEVETTYNHENLSARYKYPQVSQDTVSEDLVAKPGSSI